MIKNKSIIKNLAVIILLFFSIIITLFAVEEALAPNNSTFSGFYEEPKDTIDVAFVGGSHGMAAFSPTQMWLENQFTSYNIYSWSQNPWTAYHYSVEAINQQDIDVLVVEAFSFSYDQSYLPAQTSDETSNEFALSIPPSLNRLQLSLAMRKHQVLPLSLSEMIPFVRYHSRWTDIESTELYDNIFKSYYSSNKGFGPIFTTEVFEEYNYIDIGDETALVDSSKEYLLKLIKLCKDNDVQLILTKTPYIMNPQDRGYIDEIAEICLENEVPFLNYLSEDLMYETGFSYQTDMAEYAHVNYLGAKKLSSHMGDFIKENYLKAIAYDEETINSWNTQSAIEQRDIDNYDLKLAPTFNELASLVSVKEDYVYIITAHGDLTKAEGDHILKALDIFSINEDILKNENASEVYIFNDTEKITENKLEEISNISVTVLQTSSSIIFNGEEYSKNRQGFNVVIYDEFNDEIIHSVSFATEHEYNYYTN